MNWTNWIRVKTVVNYGEKDFMEDNQVMRDCIQREKRAAED